MPSTAPGPIWPLVITSAGLTPTTLDPYVQDPRWVTLRTSRLHTEQLDASNESSSVYILRYQAVLSVVPGMNQASLGSHPKPPGVRPFGRVVIHLKEALEGSTALVRVNCFRLHRIRARIARCGNATVDILTGYTRQRRRYRNVYRRFLRRPISGKRKVLTGNVSLKIGMER